MPTYSYRCADCEHAFDIRQSITEDSLTICPQCQGTLRKQFGSVGISFKGSGFYANDSRATSKSKAARTPESASKDSSSKETAPKESSSTSDSGSSTTSSASSTTSDTKAAPAAAKS